MELRVIERLVRKRDEEQYRYFKVHKYELIRPYNENYCNKILEKKGITDLTITDILNDYFDITLYQKLTEDSILPVTKDNRINLNDVENEFEFRLPDIPESDFITLSDTGFYVKDNKHRVVNVYKNSLLEVVLGVDNEPLMFKPIQYGLTDLLYETYKPVELTVDYLVF